eukprot:3781278-Rhodomonas_salina.1
MGTSAAAKTLEDTDEGRFFLRNNVAVVSYKYESDDKAPCQRLHYPLLRVLQDRGIKTIGQILQSIRESVTVEQTGLHLHPHFIAQLAGVDKAEVGVGFDKPTMGPTFRTDGQHVNCEPR